MQNKDTKLKKQSLQRIVIKSNSLDEGIIAFGQWLNSDDKQSQTANTITLEEFIKNKHVLLLDNSDLIFSKRIIVDITNGIPLCRACNTDDCAHVGFTICLKQMDDRRGMTGF